jgi:dCTP deaminase
MLLSHDEIIDLLDREVVEYSEPELANSSSLDIRLGLEILVEDSLPEKVVLKERTPLNMKTYHLVKEGPYFLRPGEFILAHSHEVFNLPNNISASYSLKSSMARIGLEHLNAGWCDAGWNGSVLTLELKNMTRNHTIVLNYLDLIGQMCFFKHSPVSYQDSYACRGRYNKDKSVSGAKVHPSTYRYLIINEQGDDVTQDVLDDEQKGEDNE